MLYLDNTFTLGILKGERREVGYGEGRNSGCE